MKRRPPPVFAPEGAHPVTQRPAGAGQSVTPASDAPEPAWQREVLETAGATWNGAPWRDLPGGRVNRVWQVDTLTQSVVVKRYGTRTQHGLFPNTPEHEYAALAANAAACLSPTPLGLIHTHSGSCLVYRYLRAGSAIGPSGAGLVLAKLHGSAPWPGLTRLDPERWRVHRAEVLRLRAHGLTRSACAAIADACAVARKGPPAPCPLHGDPVPANILATTTGPVLIDWQCPAIGDPATDLALYLSPAMQTLYGKGPLRRGETRRFLAVYGRRSAILRYRRVAPALHARIALHCALRGDRAAVAAEIALLNQLGNRSTKQDGPRANGHPKQPPTPVARRW